MHPSVRSSLFFLANITQFFTCGGNLDSDIPDNNDDDCCHTKESNPLRDMCRRCISHNRFLFLVFFFLPDSSPAAIASWILISSTWRKKAIFQKRNSFQFFSATTCAKFHYPFALLVTLKRTRVATATRKGEDARRDYGNPQNARTPPTKHGFRTRDDDR